MFKLLLAGSNSCKDGHLPVFSRGLAAFLALSPACLRERLFSGAARGLKVAASTKLAGVVPHDWQSGHMLDKVPDVVW